MQKHDDPGCRCARCEAIAAGMTPDEAAIAQLEWEAKALAERGFYVHYVGVDPSSPTNFNAHTHGMQAFDNHLDFQLIVPLPPEYAHNIICTLAERVKSGERFVSGQKLDKIIRGFEIKLIEAPEDDRRVLRIILPDPNGKLEPDEINEQYVVQYKDVEGVSIPKRPWMAYKPKR